MSATLTTADWNPGAYARFRDQRLRPALDLLNAVERMGAGDVVDLGCGTGAMAEALRLRSAAQTVSLADVARTTAAGLEAALRHAARWVGADPDVVRVEPNLDFADSTLSTDAVKDLTDAWQKGAFDHSVLQWNLRKGGRMPEETGQP